MNLALESGSWNLVRELVGKNEMNDFSWEQLCYIVDELDVGTHITTAIALSIFVMVCLQHPDAVSRAQRDLDSVVGPNRLPEFDDIENLPYMHAFINEMLRWQPVTPFGAPHGLTTDDEYMGYRIPKDAIILPHHWSIGRSPEVHGDPEVFRPERWLEHPDTPLAAFSISRRACSGQRVARNTLFIVISRCLWAYDVVCPKQGECHSRANSGFLACVSPFGVSFRSRGHQYQETIEREWSTTNRDVGALLAHIGKECFGP
ncbi:cytochrome P450 [Penicillium canescens]|uniref:cytochrome P450 n=1 Tax=Penicillium canescens TaxID=5083 RepID=UPI0026E0370B|nr:cytochrome P450 [Penicillium canescens]KAJ6060294.1 cytochrome P450 [Penicillium canescens]KAJ6078085.1 cytochrome P450 [Penicillium canescens]